jgi:SAM-dependent methyltransferase
MRRLDREGAAPDNPTMSEDARQYAPAAARNRDPIWSALQSSLPEAGLVLEVASGSGEHVVHFAQCSGPDLVFQPSDPDPRARDSIDAWTAATGLPNIRPALALDATSETWPITHADAVLCFNMIHIAPWEAAIGLVHGAARVLPLGGILFLYGPFKREGRHTAPSNAAFDRDFLQARNPDWGVRDLEAVAALAAAQGFAAPDVVEMPANNLSVLFRRLT